MITCNLMGGLGNQLFQIFATISYAIKSHNQFKFTDAQQLGGKNITTRNTYWDTFLLRLKFFTTNKFPQMKFIKEQDFTFNELPVNEMINKDILLYGYFQSYKYFEQHFERICRIIGIQELKSDLLNKLKLDLSSLKQTISIHFRIGDYKHLQNMHPIMTKDYYHKSLNYILSHIINLHDSIQVMYFCEDADIEDVNTIITDLSKDFPFIQFIRGENSLTDWEQMLLMSCCHYNIIANSSFSWWSAYLNNWKNKIVCCPANWFGPMLPHNTKDLCPPEWVKIIA